MTLSVGTFGEGPQKREFYLKAIILLLFSSLAGAITGFIISTFISFFTLWIPHAIKLSIFLILILIYLFNELNIVTVPKLQLRWQIPTTWVNFPPYVNMVIWGTILGSGIFTFNPYAVFLLKYIFISFFMSPLIGFIIGCVYGFSRALPTIWFSYRANQHDENSAMLIKKIWTKKACFTNFHILSLVLLLACLLFLS